MATRVSASGQSDLFVAERSFAAGFAYQDELITSADECILLEHLKRLPFKPFEFHGFLGKRRVVSFGWRYDYASQALRDADPIPWFLLALRSDAAAFASVSADSLQQILINEYAPGAGIGWHRDRPVFSDVIAVSLSAPATLRLRRRQGTEWERASRTLQPRSAYLLRGSARWEWQHSVPPVDALRYSVTFRKFAGDEGTSCHPTERKLQR